jgi:hypothetical protein
MVRSVSRAAVALMMLGLASGLAGCAGPGNKSTPTPTIAEQSPVATESAPAVTEQPSGAAGGVDQSAALDSYVAAVQASIPAIMDSSPGTYTQIQILGTHPDTVEFVYTYAKAIDPAAAASYFDTAIPTLQSVSESSMFPAMKMAGITVAPKVRFTYLNSDGTMPWSHVFEGA